MGSFSFSYESYVEHVHRVDAVLGWARSKNIDSRTEYGRVVRGWVLWPPERRAQQRRVLEELWCSQALAAGGEGRFVYVWGIPCAGKTTFRRDPAHGLAHGFVVVDPDEVAEVMVTSGFGIALDELSPMETVPLVYEEAGEIAHRLMLLGIGRNRNVLMEMAVPVSWRPSHDDPEDPLVYTVFIDATKETAERRMISRHHRCEEEFRNGEWWGAILLPRGVLESFAEDVEERPDPIAVAVSDEPGSPQDSVRSLTERYEHDRNLAALTDGVLGRWEARRGIVEEPAEWSEVYHRSTRFPDDDDLIWLSVAEDSGVLTVDEVNGIFAMLLAAADRDEGPADE